MNVSTGRTIYKKMAAMRFAQQGTRYSRTHIACYVAAKLGRGLRTSKLASLVKNF